MIHSNENIPNIQKFQYLVTSLDGCAAKIIESIELNYANYAVVWELLKRRFDDPRAIKKKHIQCLFTMPKVEKESAMAIRGLVDYTLKHLRVLKSLNLPTDSWNELVIHMIEAKLDAATLRTWEQSFLALAIDDRIKEVCRLKLCTNCLRNDHFVKACKIRSCRECSGRHNTLCHRPTADKHVPGGASISVQKVPSSSDEASNNVVVHHAVNEPTRRHVFMATAVVNAIHSNGFIVPLCILLDSASVRRNRASEIVTGLSGIENIVSQCCKVAVQSRHSSVCATIRTLIVPKITKRLPAIELDYDTFKIPSNIKLTDPEFYKRGSIDILIGAEFFFDWLELGRIERGDNLPILQSTKFGWIIAGSVARIAVSTLQLHHISNIDMLVRALRDS
ncbi:uncharacterized protein [Polyergus mexicanus]|uniref:uncharacterized protein n=1 Tax=Polyergus mexicanus TaxID=615972 RepID=UPI0038B68DCB